MKFERLLPGGRYIPRIFCYRLFPLSGAFPAIKSRKLKPSRGNEVEAQGLRNIRVRSCLSKAGNHSIIEKISSAHPAGRDPSVVNEKDKYKTQQCAYYTVHGWFLGNTQF